METMPVETTMPILTIIAYAISMIGGVGALIFGIMVGVKILNKDGTGPGVIAIILAIICNLATFIWGWVKVNDLGIKDIMKWYTICVAVSVLGTIVAVATGAFAFAGAMNQMEMEMEPMEIGIEETEVEPGN